MPGIPDPPAELMLAPGTDVPQLDDTGALVLVDEPWAISDVDEATWAMLRLAHAQQMVAGIAEKAAEWRQRIDEWARLAARPFEATVAFFDERLQAYALAERAMSPKDKRGEPTVKRITTPAGHVQTRAGAKPVAVVDSEKLVAWLKVNLPDAVKTTETPLLPVLGAHTHIVVDEGAVYGKLVLDSTGEVVPGVAVEIKPATATVVPTR